MDWDDAYSNAAYIPNGAEYPARWAKQAADFRAQYSSQYQQLAYGTHPRETLDLFRPNQSPKGLAVFVHGGYWMAFDASYWSHLAQGALEQGWAVAIPSYTLAPEATIPHMTQQIGQAITHAATLIEGPICLAGHSAGGHLVTRMMCDDSPLSETVLKRLKKVTSISGLHDLRPLIKTKMNETLHLDQEQVEAESPALNQPLQGIALTCWVGGKERPEFIRQTQLLNTIWSFVGVDTKAVLAPSQHHFSVIEDLVKADSELVRAFLGA